MKHILGILISVFFLTNIQAQCFPDRHNTNWFDGWISCSTSPSPNETRGESHWIMYNLNHRYDLGQMHVWNTNSTSYLADGMKDIVIDISDNGIDWTEVGQFQFDMGEGLSTYEGFEGPDLSGLKAKYVLITGLSNWGGSCYGLSEIKIDVHGVTGVEDQSFASNCLQLKVFPNPVSSESKAYISSVCKRGNINFKIHDIMGKLLKSGQIEFNGNDAVFNLDMNEFDPGSYILSINQSNISINQKIVKIR